MPISLGSPSTICAPGTARCHELGLDLVCADVALSLCQEARMCGDDFAMAMSDFNLCVDAACQVVAMRPAVPCEQSLANLRAGRFMCSLDPPR